MTARASAVDGVRSAAQYGAHVARRHEHPPWSPWAQKEGSRVPHLAGLPFPHRVAASTVRQTAAVSRGAARRKRKELKSYSWPPAPENEKTVNRTPRRLTTVNTHTWRRRSKRGGGTLAGCPVHTRSGRPHIAAGSRDEPPTKAVPPPKVAGGYPLQCFLSPPPLPPVTRHRPGPPPLFPPPPGEPPTRPVARRRASSSLDSPPHGPPRRAASSPAGASPAMPATRGSPRRRCLPHRHPHRRPASAAAAGLSGTARYGLEGRASQQTTVRPNLETEVRRPRTAAGRPAKATAGGASPSTAASAPVPTSAPGRQTTRQPSRPPLPPQGATATAWGRAST